MNAFEWVNPASLEAVPELLADRWDETAVMAGGTDLLDQLKEGLLRPKRVINLKALPELHGIENGNGLRIGALTTLTELAQHPQVSRRYPILQQAALSVGTPQLRNMGTVGGNLCQRPRCWYFRGKDYPCLKKGGYQCFAATGLNKYNAILGGGPSFIVHPSDLAPALLALDARVEILGPEGIRQLPLRDFFQLPARNLLRENILQPREILTRILLPPSRPEMRSLYLKFREKQSMDFAISSVAVVLEMQGNRVQQARIVLGGVASIPWPVPEAATILQGRPLSDEAIQQVARAAVEKAVPLSQNAYKIQLTQNLVRRALGMLKV